MRYVLRGRPKAIISDATAAMSCDGIAAAKWYRAARNMSSARPTSASKQRLFMRNASSNLNRSCIRSCCIARIACCILRPGVCCACKGCCGSASEWWRMCNRRWAGVRGTGRPWAVTSAQPAVRMRSLRQTRSLRCTAQEQTQHPFDQRKPKPQNNTTSSAPSGGAIWLRSAAATCTAAASAQPFRLKGLQPRRKRTGCPPPQRRRPRVRLKARSSRAVMGGSAGLPRKTWRRLTAARLRALHCTDMAVISG